MKKMQCPDCGCNRFYVKDPDDQYNISEFELVDGRIIYSDEGDGEEPVKVSEDTETYCDQCAWHDRFRVLN